MSKNAIEMKVGDTEILTVTITPSNATEKNVDQLLPCNWQVITSHYQLLAATTGYYLSNGG